MELKNIYIFLLITLISGLNSEKLQARRFPKDFLFGVATASYQIEGAWNVDGKSESTWDRFAHTRPELIKDGSTGDIACDSYNQVEKDVAIIKSLGVDYYRFSLAWTRILPSPLTNNVNKHGIAYYNKLIDLLLENGIQPMVTLYHWDLPQALQDMGGFTNTLVIENFVRYAKVAFEHFGDRVKLWTTFNEPHVFCLYGYGHALLAPAYNLSGIAEYQCAYNVLKAHAAVYHLYNNTFKPKQNGRLSLNFPSPWYEPATQNKKDVEAANRGMQFNLGLFGHPIFSKSGDFPDVVKENIAKRSQAEGFPRSRLPKFTDEEIQYIRGTYDYFCLNHYSTALVTDKKPDPIGTPSFETDRNINIFYDPSWPSTAHSFNKVTPWGLRKLLKWVKDNYGNHEIYITESGRGDFGGVLDLSRAKYFNLYLNAVLDAIYKDDVLVKGYTAWSLMDNYEWTFGYRVKFGLYHVDFSSPNRTRTPKISADYFRTVVANRRL